MATQRSDASFIHQVCRFALAGAAITLLSAGIYSVSVHLFHLPAVVAAGLSHAISVGIGFRLHAAWTFGRAPRRGDAWRYVLGSSSALSLNAIWALLLGDVLKVPLWLQLAPMILVTPGLSFLVNRWWVFGSGSQRVGRSSHRQATTCSDRA